MLYGRCVRQPVDTCGEHAAYVLHRGLVHQKDRNRNGHAPENTPPLGPRAKLERRLQCARHAPTRGLKRNGQQTNYSRDITAGAPRPPDEKCNTPSSNRAHTVLNRSDM